MDRPLGQIDFQCLGGTFRQTAQVEQGDVLCIKAINVGRIKEEPHLPGDRMFHRGCREQLSDHIAHGRVGEIEPSRSSLGGQQFRV